jgi:hypothetical protein
MRASKEANRAELVCALDVGGIMNQKYQEDL